MTPTPKAWMPWTAWTRIACDTCERGINTLEDLGDLAVIDLMDIEGMDESRAAALIMAARAPMIEKMEQGG